MNTTILETELMHATPGPWQTNGQGMIINSNTQKIIGYCSSDFDARLIVSMRNEIEELLERLEDSISIEKYEEVCTEYDAEIAALKEKIGEK